MVGGLPLRHGATFRSGNQRPISADRNSEQFRQKDALNLTVAVLPLSSSKTTSSQSFEKWRSRSAAVNLIP